MPRFLLEVETNYDLTPQQIMSIVETGDATIIEQVALGEVEHEQWMDLAIKESQEGYVEPLVHITNIATTM